MCTLRRLCSTVLGAIVLVQSAGAASAAQRLKQAPCPPLALASDTDTLIVRCATVTVPQARGEESPDGLAPVQLAVVVFARHDTPFDVTPLVYLSGGPGESAIDEVASSFLGTPTGRLLIRQRPIIAFDQRGFDGRGRQASPWLGGLRRPEGDTVPLEVDDLFSLLEELTASVRSRGVDLRNFNSIEAANDVVDVVRALGFQRAILFASSYGTRVALHVVKQHAGFVESAILDGVVPPQAVAAFHLDSANAYRRRAVKRLVDDCTSDARCHALYPRLEKDWSRLADVGSYVSVRSADADNGPKETAVYGHDLLAAVGAYLTLDAFRPLAPFVLSELAHGRVSKQAPGTYIVAAALQLSSGITTIPAYGLGYLAVICGDAPMGIPQYGGEGVCRSLAAPFGGRKHTRPVSSDTPMLLLAAGYDGLSPPEWADDAARTLSAAHVVHFPGIGHVTHSQVTSRDCVAAIVADFLDDPRQSPRLACVEALGLPPFADPPARDSATDGRKLGSTGRAGEVRIEGPARASAAFDRVRWIVVANGEATAAHERSAILHRRVGRSRRTAGTFGRRTS